MTRFFTADLHLGHRNIIEYSGRPFRDVAEMDAALVDRWNETVGDDDEVVVLGDFAMGKISETLPLAALLRGRKVLLAGTTTAAGPDTARASTLRSPVTWRPASPRSGRARSSSSSPGGP